MLKVCFNVKIVTNISEYFEVFPNILKYVFKNMFILYKMAECEYCKKKFTRQYNLNKHKKTSKQCLIIQGNISCSYQCEGC